MRLVLYANRFTCRMPSNKKKCTSPTFLQSTHREIEGFLKQTKHVGLVIVRRRPKCTQVWGLAFDLKNIASSCNWFSKKEIIILSMNQAKCTKIWCCWRDKLWLRSILYAIMEFLHSISKTLEVLAIELQKNKIIIHSVNLNVWK